MRIGGTPDTSLSVSTMATHAPSSDVAPSTIPDPRVPYPAIRSLLGVAPKRRSGGQPKAPARPRVTPDPPQASVWPSQPSHVGMPRMSSTSATTPASASLGRAPEFVPTSIGVVGMPSVSVGPPRMMGTQATPSAVVPPTTHGMIGSTGVDVTPTLASTASLPILPPMGEPIRVAMTTTPLSIAVPPLPATMVHPAEPGELSTPPSTPALQFSPAIVGLGNNLPRPPSPVMDFAAAPPPTSQASANR